MTYTYILPALLFLYLLYQPMDIVKAVQSNSHRKMVVLRSSLRVGFETSETLDG